MVFQVSILQDLLIFPAVSRALITMDERIERTLLAVGFCRWDEDKLEMTDDPSKLADELFENLRMII